MIRHLYWDRGALVALDQRELPRRRIYLRCGDPASVARAIRDMAVRGAPLIGGAAAYGFALAAKRLPAGGPAAWSRTLDRAGTTLLRARPTAVNLRHAVERMRGAARRLLAGRHPGARELFDGLKAEADALFREDVEANRRMALLGSALLKPGSTILTYCNAGALATCGVGTALGVVIQGWRDGKVRHAYACETRPYLQGSRLTLWELMEAGVPSTLITDNMAGHLMAVERIDAVIVGSDRIAANADVANKIGTYGLAVLARHHDIPFYVVAPTTTVDMRTPRGSAIPIEERSSREVTELRGIPIAPAGARARHPAFDVTPHRLVTAIVTERGVARPADGTRLRWVVGSDRRRAPARAQ